KAALRAQMLRVTCDGLEGLGYRLEQQGIDDPGILEGERPELGRQGKDHMAVRDLEYFLFPCGQPGGLRTPLALGAVPIAARVSADLSVTPVITVGFVPPEDRRTALRDGLEHAPLRRRRHRTIAREIRRPILADHISNFQRRAGHDCGSCGGASGKVSRGLGMMDSACGVTWR